MSKILLLLLFSFSLITLKAQTITFCTKINKEDQCAEKQKRFYIEFGKTSYIYAVVNLLEEVKCVKVYYKIYHLEKFNKEVYITTLSQDVLPKWKNFWKQIIFTQEMNYKIYVYDENDKLLTSNVIYLEADYEN